MTNQLSNQLSDAQLDSISGGCHSSDCGDDRRKRAYNGDCHKEERSCHEPKRNRCDDYSGRREQRSSYSW